QAVEIARACSGFRGIFYWPSWLDEAGFQAACAKIDAVLDALARAGFEAKIVSGGSTPGAAKTPLIPRTTEIRPGTYVFYDASSLAAKLCGEADCALRVLTTVVSTAVPGQCVIDAGSKTFSRDQTVGAGTVSNAPLAKVSFTTSQLRTALRTRRSIAASRRTSSPRDQRCGRWVFRSAGDPAHRSKCATRQHPWR